MLRRVLLTTQLTDFGSDNGVAICVKPRWLRVISLHDWTSLFIQLHGTARRLAPGRVAKQNSIALSWISILLLAACSDGSIL